MTIRPCCAALLLAVSACSRAASPGDVAPDAPRERAPAPVVAGQGEGGAGTAAGDVALRELLATAGSPYTTRAAAALRLLAASADAARPLAAGALGDATTATGAARFLRNHATAAETDAITAALPSARDGRADDLIAALGRIRTPQASAALVAVILGADGRRAILAGEAIHASPVDVDRAALAAATAASEPPARRQAALLALGASPESCDAPFFTEAARHLAPPFRAVAAAGLVRLPDPPRDEIVRLLSDPDLSVREAAARACAELRTPWAVEVLSAAFADKSSDMRFAAIRAAGSLGTPALAPLVDVVKNDRERAGLRGEALRSLATIDRAAALQALGDTPALFSGELRAMFEESFGVPPR